eukprot:13079396-Heterocapsa_arctica.AAC.1
MGTSLYERISTWRSTAVPCLSKCARKESSVTSRPRLLRYFMIILSCITIKSSYWNSATCSVEMWMSNQRGVRCGRFSETSRGKEFRK